MMARKSHRQPEIRIFPDPDAAAAAAAERTAAAARQAVKQGRPFNLVLPGGSTPQRLFRMLAAEPYRSGLPWQQIHFFWGDERCVPPDHPDSNYHMAREALLDPIAAPERNIHRMRGENTDRDAAARGYEAVLRNHFHQPASSDFPAFDLIFLGMGTDGHTASLFPGTPALEEKHRWVIANNVPRLQTQRLTLSPAIFNHAEQVIFLVTGADKADILAEVLEGPYRPERLPAQIIRPERGVLLWILDQAAAKRLRQSGGQTQ